LPQLELLTLHCCEGLQLDEVERRLLTPPGALGLPHLREFSYCTYEPDSFGASDEDDEDDEPVLLAPH